MLRASCVSTRQRSGCLRLSEPPNESQLVIEIECLRWGECADAPSVQSHVAYSQTLKGHDGALLFQRLAFGRSTTKALCRSFILEVTDATVTSNSRFAALPDMTDRKSTRLNSSHAN